MISATNYSWESPLLVQDECLIAIDWVNKVTESSLKGLIDSHYFVKKYGSDFIIYKHTQLEYWSNSISWN